MYRMASNGLDTTPTVKEILIAANVKLSKIKSKITLQHTFSQPRSYIVRNERQKFVANEKDAPEIKTFLQHKEMDPF